MRRVISIFLPHWAMNLRRRQLRRNGAWLPDRPLILATQERPQRTITAVNAAAAACGITPGMPLSRARAIVPEVTVEPARPHADARALDYLTLRSLRYSPLVAPCPPDGVWIDATGAAHLFGGEAAMVNDILYRLRATGFNARGAMADTPGAAWAWARYGSSDPVLEPKAHHDALEPLPLSALRLTAETTQTLKHVGLKTIGELRRISRTTIPVRFGKQVLERLDQALGFMPEPITPILPPAAKRQRMTFAEPIATPEDMQRTIHLLTQRLCADLNTAHEGARKLDMVFERVDGRREIIRLCTAHPSRDAPHLAKLLTEKLSNVDPGFGIEAASLTAWRVSSLTAVQLDTDGGAKTAQRSWAELIDRLMARAGARNVFALSAVPSAIPERAVRRADPMMENAMSWPAHLPRPSRLLSPPEPIHVIALMPDYPPAKFRWRERMHVVRAADGPERISGEWWKNPKETGEVRDYFRIENENGERYWLFRASIPDQPHRWFVHGVFA
jgi:protein ImuB